MIDINDFGVTDIRAVLLESNAEDKDISVLDLDAFLVHSLDSAVGNVVAHAVVQTSGVRHNSWQDTIDLCFLYQIIRIDAYAMAAD